jgi:hypothetical protein
MSVEIAEIFRLHGGQYRSHYPVDPQQNRAMRDIVLCRTAELGGSIELCDHGCGYARISYHSCRNRHCPKCQSLQQARWLHRRMQRLLPTHYFHMVATLPHELNPLLLHNKEFLYNTLFRTASSAVLELAKGYERLAAHVGFTAVLHTWDQELQFHPHLHIVVTGGGLDPPQEKWISSKNSFLVPVRALSKLLRGKFLDSLEKAFHQHALRFSPMTKNLQDPTAFQRFIRKLRRKKWVVYSKATLNRAQQAFSYLSRYTHRVAISNHRLLSCTHGNVTFQARDNRSPGAHRTVTLTAQEFIRRFLLHVLPPGFVRIRHYGLMAPRNAKTKLQHARRLILQMKHLPESEQSDNPDISSQGWEELLKRLTGVDLTRCPICGGTLLRVALSLLPIGPMPINLDSS